VKNERGFDRRTLETALRTDFVSFIEKVVPTVSPGAAYLDNWHVWAIAWHLEQALTGKIQRLIICLPPRSLKSIVASVALPAWALGHDPCRKVMSITYSSGLAAKYANDFRQVIGSQWYRSVFPHARVSRHKDTEIETVFTAGGFRLATSTTGTLTGRGADLLICDDPIKSQDVSSDTKRGATNELFRNTILSRLENKQTGSIIVVMQRLHANDFVGSLLDSSDGWTILNLPAIAECDEKIRISDNEFYIRRAGEPLHAAREPLSVLLQIQQEMGPDAWAAQYQQAPVPPGGLLIQKSWLRYHAITTFEPSYKHHIIQSWDTAGKVGPRNSYSVCTTWLVKDGSYYLLDLIRGRFDYPTLESTAINAAKKWKPRRILIEDASTGVVLAQAVKKAASCVVDLVPVQLDKVTRLYNQQGKFAAGRVFLPENAPFLPELLRELLSFPQSKTTDQVDSISQALAHKFSTYTLAYVR
jgi:predicted phage terminase large subunit-like protein